MTNEEKNIRICEYLGWRDIVHFKLHAGIEGLLGSHTAHDGVESRDWIPDYFNDLNAMHEAEKALSAEELAACFACCVWNRYESFLRKVVIANDKDEYWSPVRTIESAWFCATAAQRAEAFGKTLNLW